MDRAIHLLWIWIILASIIYLGVNIPLLNSLAIAGGITFLGERIFYGD